jgi:hypothetical protein
MGFLAAGTRIQPVFEEPVFRKAGDTLRGHDHHRAIARPGRPVLDETDQAIMKSLERNEGRPTSELANAIELAPRDTRTPQARLSHRPPRDPTAQPQHPNRRTFLTEQAPA